MFAVIVEVEVEAVFAVVVGPVVVAAAMREVFAAVEG